MKRRHDWLARLNAYIASVHRRPFGPWGEFDCILHGANWTEAVTGTDYAAPYRGRYHDLRSGLKLLRADGYNGPIDFLRSIMAVVPISQAHVGDLAMLNTPAGPAIGGVQGARIYYVAEKGLLTVDLLAASAAFRIPGPD